MPKRAASCLNLGALPAKLYGEKMTYSEMKPGIRYIVTKESDDGTFEAGCRIKLDRDGKIINYDAGGWLDAEDVPVAIKGMECEIDHKWLARRKAELLAELDALG
jgi:hypothetical protein